MKENLILTIDLGASKADILLTPDSNPKILANEFCMRNNLNNDIERALHLYLLRKFFLPLKNSIPPESNFKEKPKDHPILEDCSCIDSAFSSESTHTQSKTPTFISSPSTGANFDEFALPGERLYNKAIEALKLLNEKEIQKNEDPKESISAIPYRSSSGKLRSNIKIEDSLMNRAQKSRARLEKKKIMYANEKYKECSFQPIINSDSRIITRTPSKNRNILLYENYKEHQEKLVKKSVKLLREQCPFTPKIKSTIVDKPDASKTAERLIQFKKNSEKNLERLRAERLIQFKKNSEKNLERLRQEKLAKELYDPETGDALFQPQLFRTGFQEKRNLPVWEELYEKRRNGTNSPFSKSNNKRK
ncbi:hypothetical protein SteCoe_36670 [Stentor coeruleus]|uniref:Uncharacterized protein n=1 Tax=Stentor coeruleus TaxID=5963 RepID=A0A1R2APM5_9CILI|nr:hypothetical protein SteCoe_36670 [Stentor coeruleus]